MRTLLLLLVLALSSCMSGQLRELEAGWMREAADLRAESATGESVVADRIDALAEKAGRTAEIVEAKEAEAWTWLEMLSTAIVGAGAVVETSRRVVNANRDGRRRMGTDVKPAAP